MGRRFGRGPGGPGRSPRHTRSSSLRPSPTGEAYLTALLSARAGGDSSPLDAELATWCSSSFKPMLVTRTGMALTTCVLAAPDVVVEDVVSGVAREDGVELSIAPTQRPPVAIPGPFTADNL